MILGLFRSKSQQILDESLHFARTYMGEYNAKELLGVVVGVISWKVKLLFIYHDDNPKKGRPVVFVAP